MPTHTYLIALIAMLCSILGAPALGWMAPVERTNPYSVPFVLALDPAGDLFTAVLAKTVRDDIYDVIKFRRQDGRVRWRRRIGRGEGPLMAGIKSAVTTADGDVLVAGEAYSPDSFAIARLAGSDGRERWRANLHGAAQTHNHVPRDLATAVAVDPTQDVIAVGQMANRDVLGAYADFTVVNLAGASGAEQWRFTLPYTITYAHLVVVDRAGSVIAAGEGRPFGSSPIPAVVKLSGDTGEMLWHSDPAAAVDARAMVLDAGGDVFLAGTARGDGSDFGVLKLSGTTGEVLWSASISASGDRWEAALALRLDGAGGVVAAGLTAEPGGEIYEDEGVHFTVARFDTANGNRLWSYSRTGTSGGAHAVAIVGGNTVVALGNSVGKKTCGDGLLIALDVTTGGLLQSRSFDGAVSAPRCRPQCERNCPTVDNDSLSGLVADPRGRLFVSGQLYNDPHRPVPQNFVGRIRISR